ncbi:SDR family oxidoreductase [Sphingomonas sp. SUN039]|uniref:SDR family oxidoreductase n=1 Tax=Sphingomonas sp. SUN039 TaxID=2937787 RepID=UPI002164D835|nr:SDR family oxidoreductase [Sphingomonas sp. SUN039]UVO55886.1 SDR family oxidoreductase [Sphingomonas sp. SUN039]
MQVAGKTAFITGGGGGIGGGIAEALVEKGARVVLADVDLDHAQAKAAELGDAALALTLDVTSLESWAAAKGATEARFGPVDILCNNAGISTPRMDLEEVPPELFARVLAINVTGVQNGIASFAGEMKARGSGHIVNTSSMNGLNPFGTFGAYSASKFAVLGLSDALRQECAPHGVGVSTLFPGLTKSRMSLDPKDGPAADPETLAALLPRMMDPVWSGRAVVRAIEEGQAYIVTHPDYRPIFAARCEEILAAFGDPAQPGYGTGASATMA